MQTGRITTRRLMIAVAVLALAAVRPAARLLRVADDRRYRAAVHATSEGLYRRALRTTQRPASGWANGYAGVRPPDPEAARREHAAWEARMAEHHTRLRRKYQRAAWRPWEALPPDPPRPE